MTVINKPNSDHWLSLGRLLLSQTALSFSASDMLLQQQQQTCDGLPSAAIVYYLKLYTYVIITVQIIIRYHTRTQSRAFLAIMFQHLPQKYPKSFIRYSMCIIIMGSLKNTRMVIIKNENIRKYHIIKIAIIVQYSSCPIFNLAAGFGTAVRL